MFRGFGTVLNVATVLIGSGIGVVIGNRLREGTREVVTDALGLVTLLLAALTAAAVLDPAFADAVGSSASCSCSARCSSAASSARCCASRSGSRASAAWLPRRLTRGADQARPRRPGSSRGS